MQESRQDRIQAAWGVTDCFQIEGRAVHVEPWGTGHINDTFAATFEQGGARRRYILQRINTRIFKNVPELMGNIHRVTTHLRGRLQAQPGARPERETLTVIPTRAGELFHATAGGDCWRAYVFIEGARTYDVIENRGQAYEAAKAFARFQKMLADLPPPPLHEIIPHFHNTVRRFVALEQAIAADACGRVRECGPEITFALSQKPHCGTIVRALECGDLPWRVTHNDTKINNVMLDDATGAGVCVIDLDSVMPGSVLYDFGDQIRTTAGHFQENERDLSRVFVDLDYFESLAEGYLAEAQGFLNDVEVRLLPFSGLLITFTIGIRFLTDFLQGDVYFKVHRPGENLDRCRTQFALVRSIRRHEKDMDAIVARAWQRHRGRTAGASAAERC